jgi:ketosteroid isomerase-like protein
MPTDDNKALVREFYARMNSRQFDAVWDLFTPDAVWGSGRFSTEGAKPIERMKTVIVDPMPQFQGGGITFEVHALTAEGDRVAAEVETHAVINGGRPYNNHYHMLFEIRDGRIAVIKEYTDTAYARDAFAG